MEYVVDLRSDTVTRPTEEMYDAMRTARLGDDVLGDDPTVHELESLAATTVGKETAMFVPSGTMANQCALAAHVKTGDSVLFDEEAHMIWYEVAAPAVIARALSLTFRSDRGVPDLDDLKRKILSRSIHTPGTTLLCLENTHNRAGGTVIPLQAMREIRKLADEHGMRIHLDGARVFNAAVAMGETVRAFAEQVDSISFCLSKGLRSPVGSLLCGSAGLIDEARFWRKRLGGGMRQAGLLAACGIISLTKMVDRLAEDHRRAQVLAKGISELPGLQVDLGLVQTNIVMVDVGSDAGNLVRLLEQLGVRCYAFGSRRLRLVTHADVDDLAIEYALNRFEMAAGSAS